MRFLRTPSGRAALARDGQPDSVNILTTRTEKGVVLIRLRDSSASTTPRLDSTYWRGFFDLDGRLITISAFDFVGQSVSADDGLRLLRIFHSRIRYETAQQTAGVTSETAAKPQKKLFPGLFR